ncbi:larval cuticle protein A2B [Procambarus clarkii]|uniref:larval cuticle protein A2B n=1 Tax=Procambarus clarkii TaxID=6728 RepID=UPI001E672F0B|nr:larval cuticle protein A2B-like [Procambarus clarkii]
MAGGLEGEDTHRDPRRCPGAENSHRRVLGILPLDSPISPQVTVMTVAAVLVSVAAALPSDSYHQPQVYKEEPRPYSFAYGVKDDYAGTNFGQNEKSDGNTVKGSYTVHLPDGRKQTVNYVADHYNGFQADVQYYGQAQYPSQYSPPVTYRPQYGYQPAPSYH